MADTDISEVDDEAKSREQNLADIAAMRAGRRPGEKKPASPFRLILIIVAAVLMLAGGAVGAWFFLINQEEEVVEEEFVPEIIPPPELAYVKLDPMFIPVIGERTGQKIRLVVSLALEVAEDGSESKVRGILPRLHEAYLRALIERPLPQTADGRIEAVHIKNRVRAENLRILGPEIVHDVVVLDVRVQ